MDKKIEIYLYFLLSIMMIPAIVVNILVIKILSMFFIFYLVFKKDAVVLPSLVILASFISYGYIINYSILIVSILNYREIKQKSLNWHLNILLIILPIVIYFGITKIIIYGMGIGAAFDQFQLYFSLFSFFYGVLISKTFDEDIIQALVFIFILIYALQLIQYYFLEPRVIRSIFFVIPFMFGWLVYLLLLKTTNELIIPIFIGAVITLSVFSFQILTFTLILSSLLTILLIIIYKLDRNKKIIIKLTGPLPFIIIILFMIGIINANHKSGNDSYDYSLLSKKTYSFEDVRNKMGMKIFQDRGPIWVGAWKQIRKDKNWLPPLSYRNILIGNISRKQKEFNYHSHNLFLEFLRTNGIIMGVVLSILFVNFNVLGSKVLSIKNTDSVIIILTSSALANNIIGAMTGIYVLLESYAILGFTIIGIAFGIYQESKY